MSHITNSYFVYILQSLVTKDFYIGYTSKLQERLKRHAKGLVKSTRKNLPFRIIHYEFFTNKKDALQREKYLKSGYGHQQINSMLRNSLTDK